MCLSRLVLSLSRCVCLFSSLCCSRESHSKSTETEVWIFRIADWRFVDKRNSIYITASIGDARRLIDQKKQQDGKLARIKMFREFVIGRWLNQTLSKKKIFKFTQIYLVCQRDVITRAPKVAHMFDICPEKSLFFSHAWKDIWDVSKSIWGRLTRCDVDNLWSALISEDMEMLYIVESQNNHHQQGAKAIFCKSSKIMAACVEDVNESQWLSKTFACPAQRNKTKNSTLGRFCREEFASCKLQISFNLFLRDPWKTRLMSEQQSQKRKGEESEQNIILKNIFAFCQSPQNASSSFSLSFGVLLLPVSSLPTADEYH